MPKSLNKKTAKTISPRKAPHQSRAKETCRRILEATKEILETQGASSVTTRNIAEVSGVNISSIYQYYPNKQAILYSLMKDRLGMVMSKFDEFNTEEYLAKPAAEYFDDLLASIGHLQWYGKMHIELEKSIVHDAKLNAMMERHSKEVVSRLVELLRHFGCGWPEDELMQFSEYIYEISQTTTHFKNRDTGSLSPKLNQWDTDLSHYLIGYCLPDVND